MADILELVTELEDHVRLARSGLRPEFAENAIMKREIALGTLPPADAPPGSYVTRQQEVVPLDQVEEFCALLQDSLRTIRKTAEASRALDGDERGVVRTGPCWVADATGKTEGEDYETSTLAVEAIYGNEYVNLVVHEHTPEHGNWGIDALCSIQLDGPARQFLIELLQGVDGA